MLSFIEMGKSRERAGRGTRGQIRVSFECAVMGWPSAFKGRSQAATSTVKFRAPGRNLSWLGRLESQLCSWTTRSLAWMGSAEDVCGGQRY